MNGTIITIDSREPQHIQNLKWSNCLVVAAPLEYGDISMAMPDGTLILVERKTPQDFLNSVKDGRLFNQVSGLVEATRWNYVLIEGWFGPITNGTTEMVSIRPYSFNKSSTQWRWSSLQGVLLSVQEMGCGIIYDPDFHGAIQRLMNRSRADVKVTSRRGSYTFSPAETLLMALPGIGSKKAQQIMEMFPTVGYALEWLTKPKMFEPRVDGVGAGTKRKINEFVGGDIELKL